MMTTQTIKELLNHFGLNLDLPEKVLALTVDGGFKDYSIKELVAPTAYGWGKFECYHFEDENYIVDIMPNNFDAILRVIKKLGPRRVGNSFDSLGRVSGYID